MPDIKYLKEPMQCEHVTRVALHKSIVIGGASLGQCPREALPGMTLCYKHAAREAMAMMIKDLAKQLIGVAEKEGS